MDAQGQRLKGLRVRQGALQQEVNDLNIVLRQLSTQIQDKTFTLSQVKKEIEDLTTRQPVVSEHAMLRYVERVLKIDLKKIEEEILSEENKKIINQISSCKVPFKGNYQLIVRNRTVITIE